MKVLDPGHRFALRHLDGVSLQYAGMWFDEQDWRIQRLENGHDA